MWLQVCSLYYVSVIIMTLTDLFQTFKATIEIGGVHHLESSDNKPVRSAVVSVTTVECCSAGRLFIKYERNPCLFTIRVIFRGILFSLSSLYQQLLVFLSEVAQSRSMPYLTDFSLPADFSEFLGPSFESLLKKQLKAVSSANTHTETEQQRKAAKAKTQLTTRKVKEDLGVSVERGGEMNLFIVRRLLSGTWLHSFFCDRVSASIFIFFIKWGLGFVGCCKMLFQSHK